jgi:hypothetical protein
MIFQLIPVKRNAQRKYQKNGSVIALCELLKDKKYAGYRSQVFRLLMTTARQFQKSRLTRFRDLPQSQQFLRNYQVDPIALQIMTYLDNVYSGTTNETNRLRAAIGEMFCYSICKKVCTKAEIEVQVQIGSWVSRDPIDAAGCTEKWGWCLESKVTVNKYGIAATQNQKNQLDTIEQLTNGDGKGAFFVYGYKNSLLNLLDDSGFDSGSYRVFDRGDSTSIERLLMPS